MEIQFHQVMVSCPGRWHQAPSWDSQFTTREDAQEWIDNHGTEPCPVHGGTISQAKIHGIGQPRRVSGVFS